jgi:hypothetical protein
LAFLFKSFDVIDPTHLYIVLIASLLTMSVPYEGFSNLLTMSVPYEGFSNLLTMSVPYEGFSNLLTMSVPYEGYHSYKVKRNIIMTIHVDSHMPFLLFIQLLFRKLAVHL